MELKRFDDSARDDVQIPGCTTIDLSEPPLSDTTVEALNSIDENIRVAEQMAGSLLLS